jgi:glycyl-tRNA synthetase alpha subunit
MNIDDLIVKKFNINGEGTLPLRSPDGTRDTLAEFMGEIGCKIGAEIGVMRGAYSEFLCKCIPGLNIKCIDPWLSFRMNSQVTMNARYARTCRRLRHFNAEIIRKPSMEAIRDIPNRSLDFVYIDEMHEFDPVMSDLIYWSAKVRAGGIIAGHDYSPPAWYNGVKLAVDTYTQAHNIIKWYITCEESTQHYAPSFFWVNP